MAGKPVEREVGNAEGITDVGKTPGLEVMHVLTWSGGEEEEMAEGAGAIPGEGPLGSVTSTQLSLCKRTSAPS